MRVSALAAVATVCLLLGGGRVQAAPLLEDFEADFPAWETGWLGSNSNLQNYYVSLGLSNTVRGNNPDGLWVSDGDALLDDPLVSIDFNPSFGQSLTFFSLDIAGHVPLGFRVFDSAGATLLAVPIVAATMGAFTDPGGYLNFAVNSSNGIGGFEFANTGSQLEGNTSIDNVRVDTGTPAPPTTSVPEPASLTLMGLGMAGVLAGRLRSKSGGR
jgi:hypothetical protein